MDRDMNLVRDGRERLKGKGIGVLLSLSLLLSSFLLILKFDGIFSRRKTITHNPRPANNNPKNLVQKLILNF